MRHKLFGKYILATGAIILLSLTVIVLLLSVFYNNHLAEEKYKSLQSACDSVGQFVIAAEKDSKVTFPDRGLYYIMNNISTVSDFDIFITDNDFTIRDCACTDKKLYGSCSHSGLVIDAEYLKKALIPGEGALNTMGIYKMPHYVVAQKISLGGESRGYVVATASSMMTRTLMSKVARLYLLSAVVPLVLMFTALYFLTYRMTKPLNLMAEAARAMANGDFSRRIPVTSDDEIGELASAFNQMTNSLVRLDETRKDFISNVSHELKTPMTTISGFIDGIIDGTIPPEKQTYYLTLVSEEVRRLSRMVQSMLNVSRLEAKEFSLKPERFDFKEMLINIVISQKQRIDEREYEIKGLDEIPYVYITADKDLIYRAVYNLVDNAVKFTNKGGTISFAVSVDAKNFKFRIENTGMGIKQSDLPYIFERFYKGDKSRSEVKNSTGLGLYIVKTIVKNHGGSITVSSVENKFTAFEMTLPK